MLFKSKQTVDGAPVWEVDTDTQTVRHRNPKTGKGFERIMTENAGGVPAFLF